MKRYSLFTRGPFVLILLAAGLFFGACAEGPDRLAIDFSQKVDVQPKTKPPPGAALNVAVASMISPNETFVHYQALLEYLAAKVDKRINLIFRQTAGTIRRATLQEEEIRDLQERVESSAEFSGMIGRAPQMRIIQRASFKMKGACCRKCWLNAAGTKSLPPSAWGSAAALCTTRSGNTRSPSPPSIDRRPGSHGIRSHAGFLSRSRMV